MGLNNSTHEKRTYLNIVSGKFAKRVPEGTEGAIKREIEYPKGTFKDVWELQYGSIDAIIEGIEIKDTDFGEQLNIHMVDVLDKFTISLGLASREAKGFMQCLPNINIKQEITLEPYNYPRKSDGKQMIGMGIKYKGEKENIKFFYTEQNGMPTADTPEGERMDKDEFKLLMVQQTIFLKKQTKKYIEENLTDKKPNVPAPAKSEPGNTVIHADEINKPATSGTEMDDLPFRYNPKLFQTNV